MLSINPGGTVFALLISTFGIATLLSPIEAHAKNDVASREVISEIEPNGTIADADSTGIVISSATDITGAISLSLEKDIFKVVITSEAVVHFEVFDSSGVDCTSASIATPNKLTLIDSFGVVVKADTLASGIGNCSSLTVSLAVGHYYIRLENANPRTATRYLLRITYLTDAGSETEPNDSIATASPIDGKLAFVLGDHQTSADTDFYSFTVGAGQSLRLETIEGDTEKTCESGGIDTTITLYDARGTFLGSNSDSGRGSCSQIDGRSASAANRFAQNLPAGIYYVGVTSDGGAYPASTKFNYRLIVELTDLQLRPQQRNWRQR